VSGTAEPPWLLCSIAVSELGLDGGGTGIHCCDGLEHNGGLAVRHEWAVGHELATRAGGATWTSAAEGRPRSPVLAAAL
jgi:hypothetical protein